MQPIKKFSQEVSSILPQIIRGVMRRQGDVWGLGQITMPQYLALELIDDQHTLKMKDIASELNVTLPAVTGLIDRLFCSGMVKRLNDEKDRRVIHILLTAKGKGVLMKVCRSRRKALEQTFGKLTARERSQYLDILKKVKKILEPKSS